MMVLLLVVMKNRRELCRLAFVVAITVILEKKLKVREGEREREKEEKNLNKTYTKKRTNDNG